MLQLLNNEIQSKDIRITTDLNELEALSISQEYGFKINNNLDVLSEGSTPIELAQAGYICNCVNNNLAPSGTFNKISDLATLEQLINGKISFPRKIYEYQYILKSRVLGNMFRRLVS